MTGPIDANKPDGDSYEKYKSKEFDYSKLSPDLKDIEVFSSFNDKRQTINKYTEAGNQSIFVKNSDNSDDTEYNYVNSNRSKESPVADVYVLTVDAGTELSNSKKDSKQKSFWSLYAGQKEIKGNDVPIGNTFIAYLSNNNEKSTALIENTSAEQLAGNYFQSADNIQELDTPNMERSADGKSYILRKEGQPDKTYEYGTIKMGLTQGDNVLNMKEVEFAREAYVRDAQVLTMKDELGNVQGEASKRTSSASTVDIDEEKDPYMQFFKKAAALPGAEGLTKEKLTQAIEAISVKKGNGLYFDRAKLDEFLNQ